MFIVLLRFTDRREAAAQFMSGHKAWLDKGFAEGIFLMSGSLPPGLGGLVLAHHVDREALERLVAADPFVSQGVVSAEIIEAAPSRVDERLQFLAATTPPPLPG